MENSAQLQMASMPVADDLRLSDLGRALAAGTRDFVKHPLCGLFFSGIFVVAGIFLFSVLNDRSGMAWLIPAAAGFPILAPFAAAGLYEVSRREGLGEPITWMPVLTAVRGRGDDQLPFMGVLSFVIFGFWVILAHAIFGMFLGDSSIGVDPVAALMSGPGIAMLVIGGAVGAIVAFAYFAMTVTSLPMLVDKHVDFISAIIVSFRVVRSNFIVMLVWAAFVAVALFAAMLPLFLGLFVVLPILAHATWHLYRRATLASA
jgi:uncharacterized membrane protein